MSINSEQLRVLVERVDSILATRRGLLPAVQREVDDAARRKSDIEQLLTLLTELKQIETDQDALQRIEGAIDDLNRLLASFGTREKTLDALRVRFSRDTVNIGVSGEARVGKSTTLQKFSGLTDTQIPTGKGLPVTAVRSEIFNSADERAEVTFRDQKTFVTEYVQPLLEIVNKHLDTPLAVDTLAGLRTAKFPETLGANVDSVSTDSLSRLLDAQRSLSAYESLLTGSVKQVALGDLRSYVSYPTKEDLDAEKSTGTPTNRSYIAVKSVKIFCPFPRLGGLKIGLVDLPGLGEIGESVADMHLHGLEDGVDQIFPIMRPTDAEGYAKQGIAKNIDHLRRIQPGIKRRGDLITAGINVNVTLLFSLERYDAVIEAYLTGLERRQGPVNHVTSVASFFVSRVDVEVDKRLEAIGTDAALALKGKAAVANAQLAYELFTQRFSGPRWEALAARGARVQRPLWASTSTKDPSYPDTLYVDSLVAPDTVNTMPEKTLDAFDDHGTLARTADADFDAAREVLARLAEVGVDLNDVTAQLEVEGVASFTSSFDSLIETLTAKAAGPAQPSGGKA